MPITTTSSAMSGHSLSSKHKCWGCNKTAHAFVQQPSSGNYFCPTCADEMGLDVPVSLSDDAIGTVEYPDGRKENPDRDA